MEAKKIRLVRNIRKKEINQPTITNISLENLFWFEIKEYLMSFGGNELPKNIHYTIAFNPSSEYINLHLTKNTTDSKNKPRITIAAIKKSELEELMPSLANALFRAIFEPVNIEAFISNKNVFFMANGKFLRSKSSDLFRDRLVKHFKPIANIKGRRLKIKGDIDKHASAFIEATDNLQMMRINSSFSANADRAIIIQEGQSSMIAEKINGQWYKFKDNTPVEFLTAIIGCELKKLIIAHLKRSLVIMRKAESKSDTAMHRNYILITKRK